MFKWFYTFWCPDVTFSAFMDNHIDLLLGFPIAQWVKNLPSMQETGNVGTVPGLEESLEDEIAIHPAFLPKKVPWRKDPGE